MNWKLFQVNIIWHLLRILMISSIWPSTQIYINLTNDSNFNKSKMGYMATWYLAELMKVHVVPSTYLSRQYIFNREAQIKYEHVLHIIKQSMEINILVPIRVY